MKILSSFRICVTILLLLICVADCGRQPRNPVGFEIIERDELGGNPQTIILEQPTEDTYFCNYIPTGSSSNLLLGEWNFRAVHTLLKFSPDIDDTVATVDSVWITLFVHDTMDTAGFWFTVHEITTPWEEQEVSWENATNGTPWQQPGGDYDSQIIANVELNAEVPDTISFSLPDSIGMKWIADADKDSINHGVILTSYSIIELQCVKLFYSAEATAVDSSLRPQLTIIYNDTVTATFLADQDAFIIVKDNEITGDESYLKIANGYGAQSLIKFTLPDTLRSYIINRASLILSVDYTKSYFDTFELCVHKVEGEWKDKDTPIDKSIFLRKRVTVEDSTFTVNLTPRVIEWLEVPQSNYGILIRPFYGSHDIEYLCTFSADATDSTLRPKLKITFTKPASGWFE